MAHDAAPSFGFDTPTALALQATFDRGASQPPTAGRPGRPRPTRSWARARTRPRRAYPSGAAVWRGAPSRRTWCASGCRR